MLSVILACMVVVASDPVIQTDTSFAVPNGSRLALHNFAGTVVVRPAAGNVMRIRATHSQPVRVMVRREGSAIEVRPRDSRGRGPGPRPEPVEFTISAPAWMPLDLEGFHCDMDIDGWRSDVLAQTVQGGVRLRGGQGLIRLSSIRGGVTVTGAQGRMQLSSMESEVGVHDAAGEITVDAVNGDVVLERVRSRLIEAATVNGDVRFSGWVGGDGRYRLATHRGNVDVALPRRTSATVLVSTFSGAFESAIPVRPGMGMPGRNFSFTLGDGSAQVDLQSFEGKVHLRQDSLAPLPPPPPIDR